MPYILAINQGARNMSTHQYNAVNPLINPVFADDLIIAASGERYIVRQTMTGHFWLQHALSGFNLTHPVDGQIGICRQIDDLANI